MRDGLNLRHDDSELACWQRAAERRTEPWNSTVPQACQCSVRDLPSILACALPPYAGNPNISVLENLQRVP